MLNVADLSRHLSVPRETIYALLEENPGLEASAVLKGKRRFWDDGVLNDFRAALLRHRGDFQDGYRQYKKTRNSG